VAERGRKKPNELYPEDRERAQKAADKRRRGEKLTTREETALRKVQRIQEEDLRWQFYRSIPQKHWREMAGGKHVTQLKEQAERYGIPFGEAVVNLPAIVRALHEFLAENAYKLASTEGENPMSGPDSPALEKWREEKWKLARLERLERERTLVPREWMHKHLSILASYFRQSADTLQKHRGPIEPAEAFTIVMEAVDDFESVLEREFADQDETEDITTP